jgi:hypothetical protein
MPVRYSLKLNALRQQVTAVTDALERGLRALSLRWLATSEAFDARNGRSG